MNHFTNVHFLKDISFSPLRKIDFQEKINATGTLNSSQKEKEVIGYDEPNKEMASVEDHQVLG
ncbi:MAG: hypothetical protein ISS84_00910 [Candidatus Pacebacteria bacterium]|nr:hypothetical protein [Candidatus Paceibacterota bacterium]